jgi:hypothetical protein
MIRLALVAVCVAAPVAAQADPPAFVSGDRWGSRDKAGASLAYVSLDADGESAQRLETYGEYLVAPYGLGGYATASAVRASSDVEDDTYTLGNVELGGLWASENIPFGTVLRAGVVLATAGDGVEDRFANTLATQSRMTDLAQTTGDVTWVRLSMSPRARRGSGFFRVDLGADIPVLGDGRDDADVLGRVNLGAGTVTNSGNAALMVEVINNIVLGDPDGRDRFTHALSVGGRYMNAGPVQPSLAVVVPLDNDALQWALLLGAEYDL